VFTGLVQEIGRLASSSTTGAGRRFSVRAARSFVSGVEAGDSILVNGCCQTVEGIRSGDLVFTAVPETLKRSTLGSLRPGQRLNLEKALRGEQGLGGHLVTGHVDGVGEVRRVSRHGKDVEVEVSCPPECVAFIASKGSIAVDGVSLTVVAVGRSAFTVALIPYTLRSSIAGDYRRGYKVNLEVDIVARYVKRLADAGAAAVQAPSAWGKEK
jgi:riboflavin synthase